MLQSDQNGMPSQREADLVFETPRQALKGTGVTVIVTLYNYETYIKNALDSVFQQSHQNIELIVVDDASRDGSLAVARRWLEQNGARFGRAILLSHFKNGGVGRARNAAFTNATNEYVFVLDADNEIYPEAITRILSACISADAEAAYSLIEKFGEGTGTMGGVWNPSAFVRGNYIDAMALVRKSAWAAVGGYDESSKIQGCEDYDLWCKFVELGFRGEFVPEILCRYRVHRSSMLHTVTYRNMDQVVLELRGRHPWVRLESSPERRKQSFMRIRPLLKRLCAFGARAALPVLAAGLGLIGWNNEENTATKQIVERLKMLADYTRFMSPRDAVKLVKSRYVPKDIQFFLRPIRRTVVIRGNSTDLTCFEKVFCREEYESPFIRRSPRLIVDAGANIGMATLFFANKYPTATIVAIEPQCDNFIILQKNCSKLNNVILKQAALWSKMDRLRLVNPLGNQEWSYAVDVGPGEITTVTIDSILSELGVDRIDILKLDIEGSERQLFQEPDWLGNVDEIMIELHDRFRPGSSQSFYSAISQRKFHQEVRGENIFIRFNNDFTSRAKTKLET